MTEMEKKKEAFGELLKIVYELREKCPWDKKQTWESLRPMTIEELYELVDAIMEQDDQEIQKELGDVLLHVLFYAMIAEEEKRFDIGGVCDNLRKKLIVRHPHIYGNVHADTPEDVKRNWERIKLDEGSKSVLSGVPASLPSLIKASRLQEKAASVGFDWPQKDDVYDKMQEEMAELREASAKTDAQSEIEEELGDFLFSIVNFARFLGINPDAALEKTNKKFIRRFNHIESAAIQRNLRLEDMSLDEMDVFWNEAKKLEKIK
ncbi:MAG: nucleoside triphosphate pyrophosphohydrolase [Bacteroidota bacterium]|nr:nucleoside triphosphate pyrophosphohydrolase [Bacteroidota bacterium]